MHVNGTIVGGMLAMLPLALAGGCVDAMNAQYTTDKMMEQGIVYILPGIQGVDYRYEDMRQGLRAAGVKCAIKIHPWGSQVPGLNLMVNQTDVRGNRACGRSIALEIHAYLRKYPGRPVHMIGHSGGGAICVFTAEALADAGAPKIDGLVLLDASLSADYDLGPALGECRKGIINYYNLWDLAALKFGTSVFGNLDGGRGPSAGQAGFSAEFPGLRQIKVTPQMTCPFQAEHFAGTCAGFARNYIAPWILEPAGPEPEK